MRAYSPGGALSALAAAQKGSIPPTPSAQRLRRGLPGYLIPFATHAFEPQRQSRAREPLSPPVFLQISTHFTATPGIPLSSRVLKFGSIQSASEVEPRDFTSDVPNRLRSLYAQSFRTTLATSVLPRLLARSWPLLIPKVPSGPRHFLRGRFFPWKRTLRPEGLHHPRGMAGSGLRPLSNIPYCCHP